MPQTKKSSIETEKQIPNVFETLKKKLAERKNKNQTQAKTDRAALWGKIGFTLGLVSAGSWLIPILGIVVAITALVFNILGLRAEKGRWFAVAGLTLAIVFLNLTFVYGFYNVLISMLSSSGI